METKLSFDSRQKTLLLSGKAHFLHSSNVELKLNHILNTKSGNIEVFGSLLKVCCSTCKETVALGKDWLL
jgi:hypothetical protein